MQEGIIKEILKTVKKENFTFDEELIQYITDRLNELIDIPLLNEDVEKIILQAILKIVVNLLFNQSKLILRN